MMRRYDVKYMPVKNGTILSTRDGFASVFSRKIREFKIWFSLNCEDQVLIEYFKLTDWLLNDVEMSYCI